MRCDGLIPCARCIQHSLECSYEDDGNRRQRTEHIKVQDDVLNSDDGSNSSHNNNTSFDDDTKEHTTAPTTKIATKKIERNSLTREKYTTTLSSPAPQQQLKQEEQEQQHEYKRSSLKRISFSNDLYESMRQNDTSVITKSYLLGTQLPPLLFDFFNLTSQPYKIWLHFITQFRQFLKVNNNNRNTNNNNNAIPDNLSKEIINLFSKFNWLYSTIFNFTVLHSAAAPALTQLFCNTPSSSSNNSSTSNKNVTSAISGLETPTSSTSPNNNTLDSNSNHINNNNYMEQTIVYAIHALVFHAAFQSLATSCQNIASSLEYYADLFYREAHRRFWDAALLVDKNRSLDTNALLQLTRLSVLLVHYQCSVICEEQAYMTLRVGIGYALRCGLSDIIKTNSTNDHVIQTNEKKRLKALHHILDAWKTWFSFYLHRNEWYDDDNQIHQPYSPNNSNNSSLSTATLPKMNDLAAGDSKGSKQRWALQVADTYTEFLKRLSKNNMKYSEIKEQLHTLRSWSTIHGQGGLRSSAQEKQDYSRPSNISLPACILSLYHHTLTIQVFFCQIPASLSLFRRNSGSFSSTQDKISNDKILSRNAILDICDQAAADIVHIIDDLTMDYHSLPGSTTDQTRQRDPIVHTVLYPLCFAASVSVSCLRQRKPPSHGLDYNNGKNDDDDQDDHDSQNQHRQSQRQQQQQHLVNNKKNKKRHSAQHTTEAVAVVAATAAAAVKASTEPKAVTLMPIYKLQRLLNPIRSQIEVANVFTESLDEIQATAAANKPTHQQILTENPDNRRFMSVPSTTVTTLTPANTATYNKGSHSTVSNATSAPVVFNPQFQHPPAHTITSITKSSARFNDHQWPESLGQSFSDENLLNEALPLQGGTTSGRGPGFPLDRNDIDREQLEKLSRKKDLRSNSSNNSGNSNGTNPMQVTTMPGNTTVDMFRTSTSFSEAAAAAAAAVAGGNAPPSFSLRHSYPESSDAYPMGTSNTMHRRRNTVAVQQHHQQQRTLLAHNQKRQYAQTVTDYPNMDMDYQQQVMTPKRMRTNSVYSDQMDMLRTDRHQHHHQQHHPRISTSAAVAAATTTTNGNFGRTQQQMSNNLSMQEIHDQSGITVYTTDFLFMNLADPVATAAAATTNTSSDPNIYQQQTSSRVPTMDRNNNNNTIRNEPPATPEPFTSNVPGTSAQTQGVATVTSTTGGMVSNITSNAPKVPLLPAPQPNLPSNKGWAARPKDWNSDFQQSIIETLHNTGQMNVEAGSFGPGIVDPSSMNINIDPMTSHTTQQPTLNDSNSMFLFFNMENQQQQQHRLTHTSHHHQQQDEWVGQQQQNPLPTRLHTNIQKSGHSVYTRRGQQQHYQQQQRQLQSRVKSPRTSSSLNQQQHQAPSLSEPTNSSASDGRSTSASPAMFGQEAWIGQVSNQNKMAADVMATNWN
ncbi:hypothetical protein INT45_007114 [Circinella minor]|uniref:Zn(2)-C6 fungal-type domain-containing protein n=1 Tax=Circinella minor TaxID=1195481 RepID=A0A8H7SC20_9FUNG|nr:hypothetical protein INT45_007114 [Circinella minor]